VRKHIISDILWTGVGVLLIMGAIKGVSYLESPASSFNLRRRIDNFIANLKLRWQIFKHNVASDFERARPVRASLFLKETQLESYIGEPFISFTPSDWAWFWHLIYGYKSEPISLGQSIKVPYSRSEIEDILCDNYEIFCRFKENYWDMFWQLILGR